jgi:hypothetical protein
LLRAKGAKVRKVPEHAFAASLRMIIPAAFNLYVKVSRICCRQMGQQKSYGGAGIYCGKRCGGVEQNDVAGVLKG